MTEDADVVADTDTDAVADTDASAEVDAANNLAANNPAADNAATIGVNGYLWRAALDTLSFMPLASADPYGGVIVTDLEAGGAAGQGAGEGLAALARPVAGRLARYAGVKALKQWGCVQGGLFD